MTDNEAGARQGAGSHPGSMKVLSLTALADELLAKAREAHSGRSAQTIHGGRGQVLRQTMLALLAGQELAEHENPGEATLQVLSGRVRLSTSAGESVELGPHGQVTIAPQRHELAALADAVVLLTVVSAG